MNANTVNLINSIIQLASAAEPAIVDLIVKLRQPDGTVVDMSVLQTQDHANLQQALDYIAAHPTPPPPNK